MYAPEFTIVTPLMVVIYRATLHCLVNLNFVIFSEVLLNLRKFFPTYYNCEESIIVWSDSTMFH